MSDFLFEILTEEIPAHYLPNALQHMKSLFIDKLAEKRINYINIKMFSTPRRMTIYISGISVESESYVIEAKGPARRIAFDNDGKPTKAAEGFARSQGIDVDNLFIKELDGVEYIHSSKEVHGRDTHSILKEIIPEIVKSIYFPKTMRWSDKNISFARPIQSFLSLMDDRIISFDLENIPVGNTTCGQRTLAGERFAIQRPDEYVKRLEQAFVIADAEKRAELIKTQIYSTAEKYNADPVFDEELFEEVNYLVEYPTPVVGSFIESYLDVPEEVLITSMKENQRYFPLREKNAGKLKNMFITIRDGDDRFLDNIREGNEKVLKARLADALFFFNEDRKTPLYEKQDKLKKVVFHEKLGTIYDKTMRVQELAKSLKAELKMDQPAESSINRAIALCKADLVTSMVFEFTELQGIMGREYAKYDNEPDDVSEAIFEHYLPRFANDRLPATMLGRLLSISDKLDSIVGCFAIGIVPTGSQDPYALRRQALGITNIIMDAGWKVDIPTLLNMAIEIFENKGLIRIEKEKLFISLLEFFRQRLVFILEERAYSTEVIEAVLAAGWYDFNNVIIRCQNMLSLIEHSDFNEIGLAFKRVINLSRKADKTDNTINPLYFEVDTEKVLYECMISLNQQIADSLKNEQYSQNYDRYKELVAPINSFFDGVMVMSDNESVKNNRLSMLKHLADFILPLGDITKLNI